jgi:hypothetical protein
VVLVVEERVAGVVEIHLDGHARLRADLLHHLTGPVRRDELVVLAEVALNGSAAYWDATMGTLAS